MWINSNEKNPEKEGHYLCITKINNKLVYQICLWFNDSWFWVHDVRYWMPLPEMPEGVQKE